MASLAEQWQSYFMTQCQGDIESLIQEFPTEQSITVDLLELHSTNRDLAERVLEDPAQMLPEARAVLRELMDDPGPVQVHLANNPHLCEVDDISAHQMYDLVTVEGIVEAVAPVQASVVTAQYACPGCDATLSTSPTGVKRVEPTRCGECDWDGGFEFLPPQSEFVDTQRFTLGSVSDQESDDPQLNSLPVYVRGDLVGQVSEDDHVGVTGVLRVRESTGSPLHTPYLDGHGIREERDISAPTSLEAALDSHWET